MFGLLESGIFLEESLLILATNHCVSSLNTWLFYILVTGLTTISGHHSNSIKTNICFCLIQLRNMELKNHTVSLVFLVGILCVYIFVDSVNAYKVTAEEVLYQKPYVRVLSKETMMRTTMQDRYIRRRRSIKETGKEDICAGMLLQFNKYYWVLKVKASKRFGKIFLEEYNRQMN